MNALLAETLDWYIRLAQEPGWKGQAWNSACALAKEHPSIYGELPRLLTDAMERKAIKEGVSA